MKPTEGAGKGDSWRENFDFMKYWDNWGQIKKSNNDKKTNIKKLKHGKIRYTY